MTEGLEFWLRSGARGTSSNTIVEHMEGYPVGLLSGASWFGDHPHDPDDLWRCARLLDAVPSYRARIGEMATRSAAWAALVPHWAELETLLREELPSGRAPRCYTRMREILDPVTKGV